MTPVVLAAVLAAQHVHPAPAPAPDPRLRMQQPTRPDAQIGDDPHAGHAMPQAADPHAGHVMPQAADPHAGHAMPQAADPHAGHAMPQAVDPHAGHTMPPAADPHAGHSMPHGTGGTSLPAGSGTAPTPPADHYADRSFDRARAALKFEHGGMRFTTVTFNLAEYQLRNGRDGYRWDGELWHGGDINRFVLRTEGEGDVGGAAEEVEFQALYSRALDAYWNLQAGVRVDAKPNGRVYAVLGFEGLAPYWFDVESALFLSERGDLLARVQASYDQRITNRLIAQPLVEVNVAAQDVRRDGIGSGLSDVELGLRLRYEIAREFAPYLGVSWERRFGDSARFARADGGARGGTAFVLGVRTWF